MAYIKLFSAAAKHVRRQGIDLLLRRGKPLSPKTIESICRKSPIPVPAALIDFYTEIGDGLTFEWHSDDAQDSCAILDLPEFEELISDVPEHLKEWIEFSKDLEFPHVENLAVARETALRMREWRRFHGLGNGAGFCLDTAQKPAPVLFDQLSWFDTGKNGHLMGTSLLDFFTHWSKACFQDPPGRWWPAVFQEGGGIDWSSDKFSSQFRLR